MNEYIVMLAVACGAVFDTGERIRMEVMADNRLDAAIKAEALADERLPRPAVQYTHTTMITEIEPPEAMALAA